MDHSARGRRGKATPGAPGFDERSAADLLAPFDFQPQTRVIFGVGVLQLLGQCARDLGSENALVISDPGLAAAGHPQRALECLKEAGVQASLYDRVRENPTERDVAAAAEVVRQQQIDLLVAVGGGSSMDCAKGANFLATNGGRMADYQGFGKATKPMLSSIGVPTTAGTGSEAQSYALVADERTHMKMACGDRKAAFRVALLDPMLTISQPPRVTSVTGVDAMAHALESYVCTRRNAIAQMQGRAAWHLLNEHFETVLRDPMDVNARGAMQVAAHFGGMAIESSMLGACHACANPLTARYGITHGIAIGIMLPHVVRFNGSAVGSLYQRLVEGGETPDAAAEGLAERLTKLVARAALPGRLRDCGVEESALEAMAAEAVNQWTAQFNPRPVGKQEFMALYEAAF